MERQAEVAPKRSSLWLTPEERVRLNSRSYFLPTVIFIVDVSFYILVLVAAVWFDDPILKTICSCLAGLMIGLLFIVGHDACHNSFTPSRIMNNVIGRLAFLPSLHPFSLWDLGHNRTHHPFVNLKSKDYVWTPLSKPEYDELSGWGKAFYRWHRGLFGPTTYYLLNIWLKKMIFPVHKGIGPIYFIYWLDCLLVWSFLGFQIIAVVTFANAMKPGQGLGLPILFGIVLPFLFWNMLMSILVYLHHTHPFLAWFQKEDDWSFNRGQVGGSVHVTFPGPLNLVFHYIMEHTAHHALPAIPLYHLREAQAKIEDVFLDHVIRLKWTPREHLNLVRKCKLYDYDSYRWLDYWGDPTSEPNQLVRSPLSSN